MKFFAHRQGADPPPAAPASAKSAPAPLLSPPVDLVLHVGMGKTGTSSVQFFLRDNRAALAGLGVLFPQTPGRARHTRLGLFARPDEELARLPEWPRQQQPDPAAFRREFRRRLIREIEDSGLSRVLLTDEILFGASAATVQRLGRFVNRISRDIRLVVYLRRQDDHMVSRYQQGVKVGWVQRLSEWVGEDMSDLYDYRARLELHRRKIRPTELVVRRYEPSTFVGGSIYQDFLDAAGIDADASTLVRGPDRNTSLDADSVEFLRLLNLYRVENEAATPGSIDNRAVAKRLAQQSEGPVLTLPAARLDRFMAQWAASNAAVAQELQIAGGRLFGDARKTGNTTTEQHLEPTRLAHFVDLLELPRSMHTALHAIAEREARR